MKRKFFAVLLIAVLACVLWTVSAFAATPSVYMTKKITPDSLIAIYKVLGLEATGKVAVKLSTGAPGGNYFLQPALIKDLVQSINGTIVECNTAAGGGERSETELHRQVAKDHGFTAITEVDIMDADGEISIPVVGGKNLTENFVGANFKNYDFYVVLSHFKGHPMGGLGGAIKNISIGIASSAGKAWIHSGGKSKSVSFDPEGFKYLMSIQNQFLESMAEAGKSVSDSLKGKILYINVMNNLSVDCDCVSDPVAPDMHDIGILGSLDPVALDKACVDLVYAAPDGKSLIERIESRNGILTINHAAEIGLGSLEYKLVSID